MVKAERQALIDEIVWYVERTLSGAKPRFLLNAEDEPLLGIGPLRYLEVEAADVAPEVMDIAPRKPAAKKAAPKKTGGRK